MTVQIRKTPKGYIVENDGFSTAFNAYIADTLTYRVFIPDSALLPDPSDDCLTVLAATVAKGLRDYPIERACRVLAKGRVQ
jgi:hypothetical protein